MTDSATLLDSGASDLFVSEESLFDKNLGISPPRGFETVETAGGQVKVDGAGIIFARVSAPGNSQSLIIRGPATLITNLTSEHLLPLSRIARCEGCWVAFQGDGDSTTATIRVRDVTGGRVQLKVIERDGLFPLELEPLSEAEAGFYINKFSKHPRVIEFYQEKPTAKAARPLGPPSSPLSEKSTAEATRPLSPSSPPFVPERLRSARDQNDPPFEVTDKTVPGCSCNRSTCAAAAASSPQQRHAHPIAKSRSSASKRILDLCDTLHQQHGHQPLGRIVESVRLGGIVLDKKVSDSVLRDLVNVGHSCSDCLRSNSHHRRHPKFKVAPDVKPMEMIHCDIIMLPNLNPGHGSEMDCWFPCRKSKYIMLFVDQASRYAWALPMKDKTAKSVAEVCLALDQQQRDLANSAKLMSASFAEIQGYTDQRIRDRTTCFFRHLHSDTDSAITSKGTVPSGDPIDAPDGGWNSPYGYLRPTLTQQPNGPFTMAGAPTSSQGDPHRKWENGLVERKHQQVERRALSMMSGAKVGSIGYEHAYLYAVYLENLMPTSIPVPGTKERKRGVPFKELLGFSFDTSKRPLHAFGAVAHVPLPTQGEHAVVKHEVGRDACIFLGRAPYPSRDLYTTAPGPDQTITWRQSTPETWVNDFDVVHRRLPQRKGALEGNTLTPFSPYNHYTEEDPALEDHDASMVHPHAEAENLPTSVPLHFRATPQSGETTAWDRDGSKRLRPNREYVPPDHRPHRAAAARLASAARLIALTATVLLGAPFSDPDDKRLDDIIALGTKAANSIRPNLDGSIRKDLSEFSPEEIRDAIRREFLGLYEAKVFKGMRKKPPGHIILDTKIVTKVRNNNTIKARCTARGFLQRYGKDFYETYSAVARHETILLMVAIAASFGLPLTVADAFMAFVQADMREEIYIDLPKDLKESQEEFRGFECFKLLKTLYGTKQASREWSEKLSTALKACGMIQSSEDPCLYYRLTSDQTPDLIICTVVDDLLAAGTEGAWEEFLPKLMSKGIKLDKESIGPAVEFAGIRIEREGKHRYRLSQVAYWRELQQTYSERYGWRKPQKVKPVPLGPTLEKVMTSLENVFADSDPDVLTRAEKMDLEIKLDPAKQARLTKQYQSLLGSIAWAAHTTRPDLAYVSSLAGEKSHQPTARHLQALEGALAYALDTMDKSLVFDCSGNPRQMNMLAFSDSDFATDQETRKSRSGVWVAVNGSPIFWTSKRQSVVAGSSTAAETIAAHQAMTRIRSVASTLQSMGFDTSFTPLLIDNEATLKRIINGRSVDGDGAKELSVKVKMLQEAATGQELWPFYVSTHDNIADIFTKGTLSGLGATEKWMDLESRARGREDNLVHFHRLLSSDRPNTDYRGKPVSSIEKCPPITSFSQFEKEAAWKKAYPDFFSESAKHTATKVAPPEKARLAADVERELIAAANAARTADAAANAARAADAFTKRFGLNTDDQGKIILSEPTFVVEVYCGYNKSACNAIESIVSNPDMLTLISVDNDPACKPTVVADACTWDPFTVLKPDQVVHFAWFSPPCENYSRAKTTKPRNLSAADATAKACLRLIEIMKPIAWVIENPKGLLRHRPFMRALLRFLKETTYCKYDFNYRKETDLFTNIQMEPLHCSKVPCDHRRTTGRHPEVAQQGPGRDGTPGNSLETLHRVPHKLIQDLFSFTFKIGARQPREYLHVFNKTRQAATPAKAKYDTQDWMLLPHIFEEEAGKFDVDPKQYWTELFRSQGNELCNVGYTADMNSLHEKFKWEGHSFYGNPPYTSDIITRTLNKALHGFHNSPSDTEFLFVLPKWKTAPWYDLLAQFTIVREWPRGSKLFTCPSTSHKPRDGETDEEVPTGRKYVGPTPWPVLMVYKGPHKTEVAGAARTTNSI